MATDWPGHGQTNRYVHIPARCSCSKFFTANMDVPWAYLWAPLPTQPRAELAYLESAHWLRPYTAAVNCRWIYSHYNAATDLVEEIVMLVQPFTDTPPHVMEIRIALYGIIVLVEYSQTDPDNTVPNDPWNRGHVFTQINPGWTKIIDTPVPDWGPPNGVAVLTPYDCVPTWEPGESLPEPPVGVP